MQSILRCIIVISFALFGAPVRGEPITQIVWDSPQWAGLVSKDGKGLYNDVLTEIFNAAGIKITLQNVPWSRALAEVEHGNADMTGGEYKSDKFAQSTVPILANFDYIYFRKSDIPDYRGPADLDHKLGVWVVGYTDNIDAETKSHLNGGANSSRNMAMQMLLLGRAQYYLDNDTGLNESMKEFDGKYNKAEYEIGLLKTDYVYMCFTNNARGKALADIFDKGMRRLAASGKLKKIYDKWHRQMPPIN